MIRELISSSFNSLEFEPIEHKYTLKGKNMTAVSNVIDFFCEDFPEDAAVRYAEKNGMTVEEVKKKWKEIADKACDFGHETHDFGEHYFYDKSLIPLNLHQQAIVKFWSDLPDWITPIACETRVYTEELAYAGTFDLLIFDHKRNGYIIVDYKTNKDLFKNFRGKTMLEPFSFLLDNPYNHYQVQLSLYQIPLENIGVNVIDRWVIWLLPDGTYNKYETCDYTAHLKETLKNLQYV